MTCIRFSREQLIQMLEMWRDPATTGADRERCRKYLDRCLPQAGAALYNSPLSSAELIDQLLGQASPGAP